MAKIKVLLVGESWSVNSLHSKGFDTFSTTHFSDGMKYLREALKDSSVDLIHMPAHVAQSEFPYRSEDLKQYDVLCLSDIGANTFLLPAEVFTQMKRLPNRLRVIQSYVEAGGGFLMCGGYYSFQGFQAGAFYHQSPIEELLPLEMLPYDDRWEAPEGAEPLFTKNGKTHPILQGIDSNIPYVLGFNKVKPQKGADILLEFSTAYKNYPLLLTGSYGKGRTAAFTSDIAPHWLSPEFCAWAGYKTLWENLFCYLGEK